MFDKKCRECGEKVERKFRYCPWCGAGLKKKRNDFGMLGDSDSGRIQEDLKLPMGLNKIVNSLAKQLEKDLGKMDFGNVEGMPKGFKIQIGNAPVQVAQKRPQKKELMSFPVGADEERRRAGLEKVEAKSKVKRLGEGIIYEIDAPGVKEKRDVVITELETGLEIRAYGKDVCYVKTIPLKVEVLRWKVADEKVFVEFRG